MSGLFGAVGEVAVALLDNEIFSNSVISITIVDLFLYSKSIHFFQNVGIEAVCVELTVCYFFFVKFIMDRPRY